MMRAPLRRVILASINRLTSLPELGTLKNAVDRVKPNSNTSSDGTNGSREPIMRQEDPQQ